MIGNTLLEGWDARFINGDTALDVATFSRFRKD
jgi:hypothetical protein